MDVWSFVFVFVLVAAFIPFAIIDAFRDPEEVARRIVEDRKFEWRHH